MATKRQMSMTRRAFIKRAGALAAALGLGAAFVLDRTVWKGGSSPSYLPGFNDDFATLAGAGIPALRAVRACGARCARAGINWGVVQAEGPDSFDWSSYDALYQQAVTNRIQILPTVYGCPGWADPVRTAQENPGRDPRLPDDSFRTCSVEHDPDFARFADATLRHFDAISDRLGFQLVSGVEILNEPNVWIFGDVPAARVRELATAAAVKVAESSERGAFSRAMRVISGGLAPVVSIGPDNPNFPVRPSWQEYLEELLDGGSPPFDVGIHAYETYRPPNGTLTIPEQDPSDPFARASQFAEWQTSRIVGILDEALDLAPGDVWLTETGASSASIWSEDVFSPAYRAEHGEAIQAEVLTRLAGEVGSRSRCRSMMVHRLYSNDLAEPPPTASTDSPYYQSGVYESIDGEPKLAVAALAGAWA